MKKLLLAVLLAALMCCSAEESNISEAHALERLKSYAYAVGHYYETPELIYPFLTQAFKAAMSEEEFCAAFQKERSYPYLTPLYFWNPTVTMNADLMGGSAVYLRAARIEGMTYTVSFVYENGDYYIDDWAQFLDGSYLDKFENIPYSLDWYFDLDEIGGATGANDNR